MRGEEVSMNGIDVSYVQKNIDWQKVKQAGIKFVFARIGYGKELSQKDVMFESHYAGAKEAGLLVGGYHYSYTMDTEGALKEAENCLTMLEGKTLDFPIAYDIEEAKQFALSPEELYRIYKTFADRIEAAGYKCILYTNKNWWVSIKTAHRAFTSLLNSRYCYFNYSSYVQRQHGRNQSSLINNSLNHKL